MHYSLKQLALLMVALLLLVSLGSGVIAMTILEGYYHTEEEHHQALARNRLEFAALAISNQVQFYQSIADLLVARNTAIDMLSFAEENEIERWTQQLRSLLPGAFGLALAPANGQIFGDPLVQRIGPSCQHDLQRFAAGQKLPYPPMHHDTPGLEHFDLLAWVRGASKQDSGVLLLSFHVENLLHAMQEVRSEGDSLVLVAADGHEMVRAGVPPEGEFITIQTTVPGTGWDLQLYTASATRSYFMEQVIALNLLLLIVVGLVIASSTHQFARLIGTDMQSIRQSLSEVIKGKFTPGRFQPRVAEVAQIVPDIEQIAQALHDKTEQLRSQTLTDPLTELYNRRHFDVMVQHHFERSLRQPPAILMLIDLNEFKEVNDTLGHEAGDRLLRELAIFLRNNTRASDECARLGGDEFAVIMEGLPFAGIESWVEEFLARYDLLLRELRHARLSQEAATVSIGICAIDANVYRSIGRVMHAADVAMYEAKAMRSGHSRYFLSTYDTVHPPVP